MKGDTYTWVEVAFRRLSRNAVLVEDKAGNQHWIALSLLHAADENTLHGLLAGDIAGFRMRAWKAKELKLT